MNKTNNGRIRVGLVDDHTLFRRGIANLLGEFEDLDIQLQATNGAELQSELAGDRTVDVLLMDINMPLMDGYQATKWVRQNYPLIRVLALSMFDEDLAVIKMLKAGAGGYVLKESQPTELYNAITTIHSTGLYINEMVTGRMLRDFHASDTDTAAAFKLTKRELEFISHCVSELTYKEIATLMKISARSVDNYRENLFSKLSIKSRVGLVLFAIKNKLVDLSAD
jgi:DNA-binding NarL/FixJ family response regulator